MSLGQIHVTPWEGKEPPQGADLRHALQQEGLDPYEWSNGPNDLYLAHTHGYNKVIVVVRGSITFGLPDDQRSLTLHPGERLDLPAGTKHDAVVGPHGVTCLEARN